MDFNILLMFPERGQTHDLAAFASLDTQAVDRAAPIAAAEHLRYLKATLVKEFGSLELGTLPEDEAINGLIGVCIVLLWSPNLFPHLFSYM